MEHDDATTKFATPEERADAIMRDPDILAEKRKFRTALAAWRVNPSPENEMKLGEIMVTSLVHAFYLGEQSAVARCEAIGPAAGDSSRTH